MIEVMNDSLRFTFPQVHAHAVLTINFQRTLRIPDDDSEYPLPPGLGSFPLKLVDDYGETVPDGWLERGGAMLPMFQSEALWLNFDSLRGYPFAVKVATGRIDAISGKPWSDRMHRRPQDYLVHGLDSR